MRFVIRLSAILIAVVCAMIATSAFALTVEPTPTFTPVPAATIKVTPSGEPPTPTSVGPTATYTPPPTLESTATPLPPTSTPTPADPTATPTEGGPTATPTDAPPTATATNAPTATPTAVATDAPLVAWIDVQDTTTEGDRFGVYIYLNRPTSCPVDVILTSNGSAGNSLPDSLTVTVPAGQTSVFFWLLAPDNGQADGSRTIVVGITSAGVECESIGPGAQSADTVTVLDAPTNIPGQGEPVRKPFYLPIVQMSMVPVGSGFVLGMLFVWAVTVVILHRRKRSRSATK